MLAKELISNDISPLLTSETGLVALNMMDEYRISNLPIIEDNILVVTIEGADSRGDIYKK